MQHVGNFRAIGRRRRLNISSLKYMLGYMLTTSQENVGEFSSFRRGAPVGTIKFAHPDEGLLPRQYEYFQPY